MFFVPQVGLLCLLSLSLSFHCRSHRGLSVPLSSHKSLFPFISLDGTAQLTSPRQRRNFIMRYTVARVIAYVHSTTSRRQHPCCSSIFRCRLEMWLQLPHKPPGRIKSHDNVTSSGSLELCCHGEDARSCTHTSPLTHFIPTLFRGSCLI